MGRIGKPSPAFGIDATNAHRLFRVKTPSGGVRSWQCTECGWRPKPDGGPAAYQFRRHLYDLVPKRGAKGGGD